ncbi:MAG: TraB/GumN family protein [Methanomicrobiales archaeon]|nr:TraB/GumN family protein [Methanomicrobiales archaeon]
MGEIKIIGTAHVSQKSVDEVTEAIETFEPQIVAVELDRGRLMVLKGNAAPPSVDDVIKSGNFSGILAQWLLAYVQRRIGKETGVSPGAEMMAAVELAEERGIPIALADRDIQITFSRFWNLMPITEKLKMVYVLIGSVAGAGEVGEKIDIDSMTDQDVISAAMEEFRRFAPKGASALIDERDAYLAHAIYDLGQRFDRVLAVVGAGHREGIARYLDQPETLPTKASLMETPKTFPWMKVIGFSILALFALFLILIAFSGVGLDVLFSAMIWWVLINGILAAIGVLAARGHPLSALTAFAVAWMTSLNPFMAAGWFAAITEAKIRHPTGADFSRIAEADDLSQMRENPLFRVVLVAALANVGSIIGTFAYILFIMPILGIDPRDILSAGVTNLMAFLGSIIPF